MSILRIICSIQRIEREYLNRRFRMIYYEWPDISWIYLKYIRIWKDVENFNFYGAKSFGFLFLASNSYVVFWCSSVVIFFTGYDSFIIVMTLNTALTLSFLCILLPCIFSGFMVIWVCRSIFEFFENLFEIFC